MLQQVDDISIMGPVGEVDSREGRKLLKEIISLIQHEWNKIVLDFQDVEYVHYRFLSELSSLADLSSGLSGGIKLANVNSEMRQLLRIVGADRHFETYDSVAEAILSFEGPAPKPCRIH